MMSSGSRLAWGALLIASVLGGAWWWHTSGSPAEVSASAAAEQASSAESPESAAVLAKVIAEQQLAAKVVEQTPQIKPIEGPVTQRPAFVSEMEWQMLQGVAQQHPRPSEELSRLVNSLRFNKQVEAWEAMSPKTDAARRQVLANELLADLPQRLTNGDTDLPGARQLQAALLVDAEPDASARQRRATQEARRLVVPAGG
jgi:hypothetical protein